jgi:GTP-binding protein Era
MAEVDVLALVVDVSVKPGTGDRYMLDLLKETRQPAILVLNKVDLMAKPKLLPVIDHYRQAHPFAEIVPVSAGDGTNVDVLERLFLQYLPDAEIVREQVLRLTHDELPFSTAVVIDKFDDATDPELVRLYCTILVERESQKPIVIGKGGAMIKQIGSSARSELEDYLEKRVYLDLHVKVKSEWRDDERILDEIRAQNRET